MRNYFMADMERILKRWRGWMVFLLLSAAYLAVFYASVRSQMVVKTQAQVVGIAESAATFVPLAIGIVTLLMVFMSDMKAKTMKVAIGEGMPRWEVVCCKTLECGVISALLCVIYFILSWVLVIALSGLPAPRFALQLFHLSWTSWLVLNCNILLSLWAIFLTQNTFWGLAALVVAILEPLSYVFSFLSENFDGFRALHLDNMMLGVIVNKLQLHILFGFLEPILVLGILVYFVVALFVTVKIFEQVELEF